MPWYDGYIPASWKAALERVTGARFAVRVVLDPDGQNVALNGLHDIVEVGDLIQAREMDIDYGGRATVQDVTLVFNDPDGYYSADTAGSPFHQCEATLDRDHAAGATSVKLYGVPGVVFAAGEVVVINDGTNTEEVTVSSFTAAAGIVGYHEISIASPGLVHSYGVETRVWTRPVVGLEITVSLLNVTEATTEQLPTFRGRIVRAPELDAGSARITIADSRKLLLDTTIVSADSSSTLKLMTVGEEGELTSSIDWGDQFNKLPLVFTIDSGSLPAGLLLDLATGVISGTPATVESCSFTVRVTNAEGEYATQDMALQIVGKVNTEFDSAAGTTDYEQVEGDIGWNSAVSLSAREGYCRFSITNKQISYFYWDNTFPQNAYNAFAIKNPDSLSGDFCLIARIDASLMPSVAQLYFGIGVILGSTGVGGGYVLGYNRLSTRIGVYDAGANNNFGNALGQPTTMEFRVRRVGTTYNFSYRAVGGSWSNFSTKSNATAVYKIGLIACTDDAGSTNILGSADFDFLRAYYGFLAVATTALPGSIAGDPYNFTLRATGGAGEYSWDVSVGSLPAGLTLDASTGVISGTPTANGTSNFTIRATDGAGATATAAVSIVVSADYQLLPTVFPYGEVGVEYSEALRLYVGGALDRSQVTIGSRCPLGHWTFRFLNGADFEVETPGLGNFTGAITEEFLIPNVLTIPAAAWTAGMAKDDIMTMITGKTWAGENPVAVIYDILTTVAGLAPKQLHASSFFGDVPLGAVASHDTATEEITIAITVPAVIKAGEELELAGDSLTVVTGNTPATGYPPAIPLTIEVTATDYLGAAAVWLQRAEPDPDWTFDAEYLFCQVLGLRISLCLDREMTIAQAIEAVGTHVQLFTFHDFGIEHCHAIRPRSQATVTELTDSEAKEEVNMETVELANVITVKYGYDYFNEEYLASYTFPESDSANPSILRHGVRIEKTVHAPGIYDEAQAAALASRVFELYQAGLEIVQLNLDLRALTLRIGELVDVDIIDPDIAARMEIIGKKLTVTGGKNIELAGYNRRGLDKFALADEAEADINCTW